MWIVGDVHSWHEWLAYFNCINSSNSFSISFDWAFSWRMRSIISSYWVWLSRTSLVYGCLEGGNFSCFFKETISLFFFFISFSTTLMSLGLYPISITKSSSDLILLFLAYEDAFSSLNCVVMLSRDFCSFWTLMTLLVIVKYIILPTYLWNLIWSTGWTFLAKTSNSVFL